MGRRSNGEGNFTLLPNGKFKYRITAPEGSNKKEISVTANSKTECKSLMKKKLDKLFKVGANRDLYKSTLLDLVKKHFLYDLSIDGLLKPKGADRREVTINNQIDKYKIARLQVISITDRDISNHIEELKRKGYSISTIEKAYDVINSAFKWAVSKEYIIANPCDKIHKEIKQDFKKAKKKESGKAEIMVLSNTEIEILHKELDKTFGNGRFKYSIRAFVRILELTGMRCGELCALKWENYNENARTLTIKNTRGVSKNREEGAVKKYTAKDGIVKTCMPRTITLDDEVVKILNRIKTESTNNHDKNYILVNRNGNPSNSNQFCSRLDTIYSNCGLKDKGISGAHIFRRTFATNMYQNGASISEIANYMGDLEDTILKCYVNPTRTIVQGDVVINAVPLPKIKKD